MKAIVIEDHGPPESLVVTEQLTPEPGPGEVRVRVRACALNHLDTWVRRGVPGHRFPLPMVPGSDVAGILETPAPGFEVGDEVVVAPFVTCGHCGPCLRGDEVACRQYGILGESRDGGCAEHLCVPQSSIFPKPASLSFPEAASVLLAPLTAYHMVVTRAHVKAGESVLVTAAAGGVGIAAVQIAAAQGGRVTGVVGSVEKVASVKDLGAHEVVVVPRDQELMSTVKSSLGKVSFDAVIDSVGGEFFEAAMRLIKPFGRLVTCGATANGKATIDLRRLFFLSLSVLGSTMGSRWEMAKVLEMAEAGTFRPLVHAVLPLEQLGDAHRILEERRVIGKVVVEI